jgi:hypothetical protein
MIDTSNSMPNLKAKRIIPITIIGFSAFVMIAVGSAAMGFSYAAFGARDLLFLVLAAGLPNLRKAL